VKALSRWWDQVGVQQKDQVIILVLCLPLLIALTVNVFLIHELRFIQQQHERAILAREGVLALLRFAGDIEDSFRGYLLSQNETFLAPLREPQTVLQPSIKQILALSEEKPDLAKDIKHTVSQVATLLTSTRLLVDQLRAGETDQVMAYVRSRKGLPLSNDLRINLRRIEDHLEGYLKQLGTRQVDLAHAAFWGMVLAVVGCLALVFGRWLLRHSISRPLTMLHASLASLNARNDLRQHTVSIPIDSKDELGKIARTCERMIQQIQHHLRELDSIREIGHQINSIGHDGLEGVLRKVATRSAELLKADLCLVMLRHEQIGCWIIEAASGELHAQLHKSVMLWDEFPVAVRAYETKFLTFVEDISVEGVFRNFRLEVMGGNRRGRSRLAVPLLSEGHAFGVLVLLRDHVSPLSAWNTYLAEALAQEAAIAIANARLYEAAQLKGKRLELRLWHLEHLAEMLAHDLKGPGERMGRLASRLAAKFKGRLDEETARWLLWMQSYGNELSERIETLLDVARVGSDREAVEVVDPSLVLNDVLKAKAGDLEERKVRVVVDKMFPLVPGHQAYMRQVLDNLISNAITYTQHRPYPEIRITSQRHGNRIHFSVTDNGCGIAPEHRAWVFEPFVRLNPESGKGSGIGLTIVKQVVELYGGQVWIEEQNRPGCTVTFTWPVLGELPPIGSSGPKECLHPSVISHPEPLPEET